VVKAIFGQLSKLSSVMTQRGVDVAYTLWCFPV